MRNPIKKHAGRDYACYGCCNWGFGNFTYVQCNLLPLRVLLCLETLVGHVMYLKGLRAAVFESSDPLHLLRLNGRVSAIPT